MLNLINGLSGPPNPMHHMTNYKGEAHFYSLLETFKVHFDHQSESSWLMFHSFVLLD